MRWMWFVGLAGVHLVCLLPAEPQAVVSRPSTVVSGVQITSTRTNLGGGFAQAYN